MDFFNEEGFEDYESIEKYEESNKQLRELYRGLEERYKFASEFEIKDVVKRTVLSTSNIKIMYSEVFN